MKNQINSTLQILLTRFDGQVLIPFAVGSKSVGIPEQTARNKLVSKSYPIKTVKQGSRRFIHVEDLAAYVESLRAPSHKKTGRLSTLNRNVPSPAK
jgi:hypothetical protein